MRGKLPPPPQTPLYNYFSAQLVFITHNFYFPFFSSSSYLVLLSPILIPLYFKSPYFHKNTPVHRNLNFSLQLGYFSVDRNQACLGTGRTPKGFIKYDSFKHNIFVALVSCGKGLLISAGVRWPLILVRSRCGEFFLGIFLFRNKPYFVYSEYGHSKQ